MKMHPVLNALVLIFLVMAVASCAVVKPDPLTKEERQEFLKEDEVLRDKFMIPVNGPISLYEAMARTIKSNIDYRLQIFEAAVSDVEFEVAVLDMLPELKGNQALEYRDPESASRSISTTTREESLEHSSSQQRNRYMADIGFTWNIIDLGISYVQALQKGDAALIQSEMRRKVLQNLLLEVRKTYWRALFAQDFEAEVLAIKKEAEAALDDSRSAEEQLLMPPLQALRFQRALLELITQLETLQGELSLARLDLLKLMNIPLDAQGVQLLGPQDPMAANYNCELPKTSTLVDIALDQRPELRKEMYNSRISRREIYKVILDTIPGLEVKTKWNYDSNIYLENNSWWEFWFTSPADFIDIITAPERAQLAFTNEDLADVRRLATHIGVVSQVHISVQQYRDAILRRQRTSEIGDVEERINTLMQNQLQAESIIPLESIRQRTAVLFAKLNEYKSISETQDAFGKVLVSVGVDFVPMVYQDMSLAELTRYLESSQALVEQCDLEPILEAADYDLPVGEIIDAPPALVDDGAESSDSE